MASLPAPDNGLLLLGVPFFRSVFVVHDLTDPRNLKYVRVPLLRCSVPSFRFISPFVSIVSPVPPVGVRCTRPDRTEQPHKVRARCRGTRVACCIDVVPRLGLALPHALYRTGFLLHEASHSVPPVSAQVCPIHRLPIAIIRTVNAIIRTIIAIISTVNAIIRTVIASFQYRYCDYQHRFLPLARGN